MPLLTAFSESIAFGRGGAPVFGWVTSTVIDVIEGTSSDITFTAVDPLGGTLTYAIQSGTFPTGITFNSDGTLTGTFPNEASDTLYPVTIRATSSLGPTADKTFDLTVKVGTISWTTAEGNIGSSIEGSAFSQTVEATTNTPGTISYAVTTGSLPSGLSLNGTTGVISGTSPEVGANTDVTFSITASDTFGSNSERSFTITVTNGIISWTTAGGNIGSVQEGDAFSQTVSATTNTTGTISYAVTTGSLPSGLSLNSTTGVISGTANAVGANSESSFTITASDTFGNSATRDFTITVTNGSVSWSTSSGSLGSIDEETAFSSTLSATTTTTGTISYSVTTGSLPGGLSLNSSTGAITGTANAVEIDTDSDFTVTASDTFGNSATRDFTITVIAVPGFTFTKTISSNTQNYNLRNDMIAAGWDGVLFATVSVTINSGVYVWSDSTETAAFTTGTMSSETTISIVNNGYIIGKGGNGGSAGGVIGGINYASTVGGPAMDIGYDVTITNNKIIAGGGGGGGASIASGRTDRGSGGGGGAGGGDGGKGNYLGASGAAGGGAGLVGIEAPSTFGATPVYTAGGGGGGRRFNATNNNSPGAFASSATANATNTYWAIGGNGGSAGGSGAVCSWTTNGINLNGSSGQGGGNGSNGGVGSGGQAGAGNGDIAAGGGGGGWGASGGSGYEYGPGNYVTYPGAAGGKAVNLNGNTVTWVATGTRYGAIS